MASVSIIKTLFDHRPSARQAVCALAVSCLVLGGCEAKVSNHGHALDEAELNTIKIGESTRIDLLSNFGMPSFEGAFNSGKIYYVSQIMIEPAGGLKKTETRQLFAFSFDENDVLVAVDLIDESSGNLVLHLDQKTPTPGDNFGVIDQIFSNLKRRRNQDTSTTSN